MKLYYVTRALFFHLVAEFGDECMTNISAGELFVSACISDEVAEKMLKAYPDAICLHEHWTN